MYKGSNPIRATVGQSISQRESRARRTHALNASWTVCVFFRYSVSAVTVQVDLNVTDVNALVLNLPHAFRLHACEQGQEASCVSNSTLTYENGTEIPHNASVAGPAPPVSCTSAPSPAQRTQHKQEEGCTYTYISEQATPAWDLGVDSPFSPVIARNRVAPRLVSRH